MPKYDLVADQLKHRIQQGDYALRGLPAERQLAMECGVAHMTARRAVQQLIDQGFLLRRPNGRIDVRRDTESEAVAPQIAFLAPAFPSVSHERMHYNLGRVAEASSVILRHVVFRHWDDPVIGDTLESFDGIFLLPGSSEMPQSFLRRLTQAKSPLVMLEEDLSDLGIPSIRNSSPTVVQSLLDHMEQQGHQHIDCLNVQPHHSIIAGRIDQWRIWKAAHGAKGNLFDEPVQPYTETLEQAHMVMTRLLKEGQFQSQALLASTLPAAIGAMRAMYEAGLQPGVDVAVAAVGGEGAAAYYIPSITATEMQDITPFYKLALDWMVQGQRAWQGSLLMQPSQSRLVVRESTSTPYHSMNRLSIR